MCRDNHKITLCYENEIDTIKAIMGKPVTFSITDDSGEEEQIIGKIVKIDETYENYVVKFTVAVTFEIQEYMQNYTLKLHMEPIMKLYLPTNGYTVLTQDEVKEIVWDWMDYIGHNVKIEEIE